MPASPSTFVLTRAFRPFLNAIAASLFSLTAFVGAMAAQDPSARTLATIAGLFMLAVTADALIPSKIRCDAGRLRYRNTFAWTSWGLDDIDSIQVVQSRWLGLNVTHLSLLMKDGRCVVLEDTMARREVASLPGGPVWAARAVAAGAGVPCVRV